MTYKSPIMLLIGAFAVAVLSSASGCNSNADTTSAEVDATENKVENTVETPEATDETTTEAKVPTGTTKVKISTPKGDMIVMLYDDTPIHRDNFVKLVNEGFYNDLLWHRVIENFMIQGGDPESRGAGLDKRLGSGGPGYLLENEIQDHIYHKKGALSAARTGGPGNPTKKSSGSQFYVVQGQKTPATTMLQMEKRKNMQRSPDNQYKYSDQALSDYEVLGGTPHLDSDYTVFGEVIEGLWVVDSIAAVKTLPGDRPAVNVTMSMEIIK